MRKKIFVLLAVSIFFVGNNVVNAKSINEIGTGDYIKMKPSSTSMSVSGALTGCQTSQIINPSELNMWRVIRKNDNGTVDVVANNVSKEELFICGETGYRNLIAILNTVAGYYANDMFTNSSRHIGYKNQTNTISGTLYNNTLSTNQSENNGIFEDSGGGDLLYQEDYDLTNSAIGTLTAKTIDGTITSYWLASRNFYSNSAVGYSYGARVIGNSGAVSGSTLSYVDHGENGSNNYSYSVRPILTLKETILLGSGDGKSENTAYELKPNNTEILNFIVKNFEDNKSYFKTKKEYTIFSEIIDEINLTVSENKLVINKKDKEKEEVVINFDGTMLTFEPNLENNYSDLNRYLTSYAYYTYYALLYTIGNYRGYSNDEIFEALEKVKFSVEDITINSVPLVGNYNTNQFEITLNDNYDESAKSGNKINIAPSFKINIDDYDLKDLSINYIDATNIIHEETLLEKIVRYIKENKFYVIIGLGILVILIILFIVFTKGKKKSKIEIDSL